MSIKVRLALLMGVLLLAFLFALQILRQVERRQTDALLRESLQTNQLAVRRWIDLLNQPLKHFAQDFSQWGEMTEFLARRDPDWAEKNLRQNLANYEAYALWVLDDRSQAVYSTQQNAGPPLPPPVNPTGFTTAPVGEPHDQFFLEGRDGLLEIWCEPIGADSSGRNPRGWFLVARLWNPRFLGHLGELTDARIQLAPAEDPPGLDASQAQLLLPLNNRQGKPLRQLQARIPLPDFSESLAGDTLGARLFVVFGLLVVATVWLAVRQWVLRPLDRITESLAREDATLIQPLQRQKTELGRVAQLVELSFTQKSALRHENEERKRTEAALHKSEEEVRRSLELRARLARDLHDGVIQSIYAAGLGLESAMSEMEQDTPSARTRLQHCRQSLNDIIREVRGFLGGLEPDQMQRHGFAQELDALARTMQALWPVRIELKVDPQLARQLSASQEVHALQITRECISNSLRHGDAKNVVITLDHTAPRGVMTIRDDGRGFDPDNRPGTGSGLINIAARAREMGGALRVDSKPGQGAAVIVTFPLAENPP